MKLEYWVGTIGGLFLLAYVLEAVIDPLAIDLATPYQFVSPQYFTQYPFTSAIIFTRALAIFLTPLFLLTLVKKAYFAKALFLLVLAGLMQLYALQNIVTKNFVVNLEWALSLALAGIALLLPAVLLGIKAMFASLHTGLVKTMAVPVPSPNQTVPKGTTPEWLDNSAPKKTTHQ